MDPAEFNELPLPPGKDALLLLNVYSTFMLRTGGLTAIFDPVAVPAQQCRDIDVVVITHEHGDHFDRRLVDEIGAINAPWILTTPFIAGNLSAGQARIVSLKVGDAVAIAGVKFHAEKSEHPGNQPLAFVVETANTVYYHPDDSQPFPDMAEIRARFHPDVMLYLANPLMEMPAVAGLVRTGTVLCPADPRLEDITLAHGEVVAIRQRRAYLVSRTGWSLLSSESS